MWGIIRVRWVAGRDYEQSWMTAELLSCPWKAPGQEQYSGAGQWVRGRGEPSGWQSSGVKGGVRCTQNKYGTWNFIQFCLLPRHETIYFDLSYLRILEGGVNLKPRKNDFLTLSPSVGYLEEIRDINQNSSWKNILANIYFQNNVPGTGGSHHI